MSSSQIARTASDALSELASVSNSQGRESRWIRWLLQTARRWDDVSEIVRLTELEPIDDEHRHLAELTLSLSDILEVASRSGLSLPEIKRQELTLQRLRAAAAAHFRREERTIGQYGLPRADDQTRAHAHFLSVLDGYIADFKEGRLTSSGNMRGWLIEWLITHANTLDYDSFNYENWTPAALGRATSWQDVVDIVHFTEIEDIDLEHRRVIEDSLKLTSSLEKAKDPREILPELDVFEVFVDRHCRHEEMIIWYYGLPERERQEREHEEMRVMLSRWHEGIVAGKPPNPTEMRGALLSWWLRHMNDVDGITFSSDAMAATVFANATNWDDVASFVHATGALQIDDDHARTAEQIIDLRSVIGRKLPLETLLDTFDKLQANFERHFKAEETHLAKLDELSRQLHLEDHIRLTSLIRNIREDFRFGRMNLTEAVYRTVLKNWVVHINRFDQQAFGGGSAA